MKDYEKTYEKNWKILVENEDGTLNVDAIKRELHDYSVVIREVSRAYWDITGGHFSKPTTDADYIIEAVNSRLDNEYQEGLEAGELL